MTADSLFGGLPVRLDPWQAEYGPGVTLDASPDQPSQVQLDVEVPADQWSPCVPAEVELPGHLVFVDGVRRVDARVVVQREQLTFGAFGSYGVGCVHVRDGQASFGDQHVGRVLVLGNGLILPGPVDVGPALHYRTATVAGPDFDDPARYIHTEMRRAEERLSRSLAEAHSDALVLADGPLSFETPIKGDALGYVKRLVELYLPREHLALLSALPLGHRTPLFALTGSRRFDRYSWFVRIADPAPGEVDLTGVVRLECAAGEVGIDRAIRLADASARLLPAFVPSRSRDPRSPQNLLPIGALEERLRHLLGDLVLVRRHIATLLAGGPRV
ncbi:MAG: hypothetical protein H6738_12695 [Alphaproteobacteria bacterium]|nr:hypothetical protein [Alphaproteobacteria bacterium]